MTPERKRVLKRVLLHGAVGWITFLAALVYFFPYDRVKERVIAIAGQFGYEMDVAEVGPLLGVGVRFSDITIRSHAVPPAKPTRMTMERASVRFSPFALLRGATQMSIAADAFGGNVSYVRRATKTEVALTGKVQGASLGELPGVGDKLTIPLFGTLGLDLDLTLPMGRLGEATGAIEIACAGCAAGDGKAKLKVAGNPLLAEGLTVPRIRLGDLEGTIDVEKGKGELHLAGKSPDGEIKVDGELTLRDPVSQSSFRVYLQFKVTEKLRKSADQIDLLLQLGEASGKRSDGFYGLVLSGRLDHMDPPLWNKNSPLPASGPSRAPRRSSKNGPRTSPTSPSPAAAPLNIAPAEPLPPAPAPAAESPQPAPEITPAATAEAVASPTPTPATGNDEPIHGTPPAANPEPVRHTLPVPAEPPARPEDQPAKPGDDNPDPE